MNTETENRDYNYIVGIGASAGGLEALQKLLSALPSTTGFPYIIVQHLSPDYKSLLGEILGKYTEMPVVQAENDMVVEKDHVYIIPPGKMMTLARGKLHLTNQIPKELNLPVDALFRSMAEEAKSHAIAIVLSGTGSDGTNGVKAVKENGGMVIVQDLSTAKFDGMPRSAMRTGLVDAQITPVEIALEIEHIAGSSIDADGGNVSAEIDTDQMGRVYAILKKISNVNFTHYKQTTIIRRMERRMMLTRKDTLSEYVDYLYECPEEVRTLSKEVLIGVTSFFRDPDYFTRLKDKAITDIINRSTPDEPIRVWVAGCSTGEEAYSIAILFCEALDSLKEKRVVKIFATDLDVESINIAGKGVFGDNITDSVSTARLSRYFTRRNNTYTINREIRKMIVFSPHNVFQDPPFGRLHLISCRNMLIYFQPVLQNDLFAIFHQALKDGGYLFLGKSEAIGSYTEAFPVVDAAAKLFSHHSNAKIEGAKKVPYLQTSYLDDEYSPDFDEGYQRQQNHATEIFRDEELIETKLLERFLPACVVVNKKNEMVHSFGNNSNVVHLSVGRFSNNLFDIVTEELKIPASTLLKEAREKCIEVQYKDIHFTGEQKKSVIDMMVLPIGKIKKDASGLFAIVFDERGIREEVDTSSVYSVDRATNQRITDLEQDLSAVQDKLDRSVAEQECVNEELQAANEELLTSNEELQSSNEELQSVNEELYTVNSEYQQKLIELNELNDDISNFLTSTLTGIIFVDSKLRIRRYTDYVTSEFSVMNHDIGRSLAFISYHFPSIDIADICNNVLKSLIPDEREVATNKNKVFFMRVAPYRSTENKIMGCVITLMDVTSQKRGQVTLQNAVKQLSLAQQASEAKSDYLSSIAHEIRTPMTSLISLYKSARQQVSEAGVSSAGLDKMSDTIDYIAAIVAEVSEASISEHISNELATRPFSLHSLLDNISSIMEPLIKVANITFDLALEDDFDPTYVGNMARIQQLLMNFLHNSVKFTKPFGAVSLRAYEESEHGDKVRVCFIISDTGTGMSAETTEKLFKPYVYDDNNNQNSPMGMGLGLAIAYNLIKSMDGDVTVESKEGSGSTFTIHIMLDKYKDENTNTSDDIMPVLSEYNLEGCNVLIVEDNALNRTILGVMLNNEGITFVEAADGESAIEEYLQAPEFFFSCILMDMRMPRLNGIKATARIRASGRADSHSVPIIGVSANGYAEDIRLARQAGIDDYVTKPVDRDELLNAITKLLRREG